MESKHWAASGIDCRKSSAATSSHSLFFCAAVSVAVAGIPERSVFAFVCCGVAVAAVCACGVLKLTDASPFFLGCTPTVERPGTGQSERPGFDDGVAFLAVAVTVFFVDVN
jgi:hypothetical protein